MMSSSLKTLLQVINMCKARREEPLEFIALSMNPMLNVHSANYRIHHCHSRMPFCGLSGLYLSCNHFPERTKRSTDLGFPSLFYYSIVTAVGA